MSASWKPLYISSSQTPDQPPLFISSTFTAHSYTIQITDLTSIWAESLDRKAIIKRSFSEDTAIDPSEDAEQMHLFLQKIEAGIHGDEGTAITLIYNSTPDAPCLKLQITANLPKPLHSLKWPVFLSQSAPSSFTEKIMIPLLAAQSARIKETESLIEVLKDKDHVIQKLVDKLEASSTDMGHIFPSVAMKGGRKTTKAQAEAKVKGLGTFDKARWKKDLTKNQGVGDLKQLAFNAFSMDDNYKITHSDEYSVPTPWNDWWKSFIGSSGKQLTTASKEAQSTTKLASAQIQTGDGIDDFQVQSTPPPQSQRSNNKRPSANMDDSTEDEDDDLGAPSQHSVIPDSFPTNPPPKSTTKASKLGVIGRPKSKVERSSPPPADAQIDDTTTEDELSNLPSRPPPSLPEPKATIPVKPKIGGLGRIGGRKKEATPLPLSPPVQPESESTPKKTPHKLDVIGHKAQRSTTASPVREEIRGRSPITHKKDESPPRETSEERTLRRRDEIRKELSEKAKKPVKKKRKF